MTSIRPATERQRTIFAAEGRPYPPKQLIQPADIAELVLCLLRLPLTREVTDLVLRPMQRPNRILDPGWRRHSEERVEAVSY
jgi:hypothetical protein